MKRITAILTNLLLALTLALGSSSAAQSASAAPGATVYTYMPLLASRNPVPAAAVSAGGDYTCALTTGGGVMCWGLNTFGQLGDGAAANPDGTYPTQYYAVPVSELSSQVTAVSAGRDHTCALMSSGSVKCWGFNGDGELGDGTHNNSNAPVDVIGLSDSVKAIAAGGSMTCALLTTGSVQCWGVIGSITSSTAVNFTGLGGTGKAISAGLGHVCVVLVTSGLKCWGANDSGQLGNNSTLPASTAVNPNGLSSGVTAVSSGYNHTCALLTTGSMVCWGDNSFGELGNSTTNSSLIPIPASGITGVVSQMSAGKWFTCALTSSGASCWGNNANGQLGDGTATTRSVPAGVQGLHAAAAAISAGASQACALLAGGGLWCWGGDASGQVGDATYPFRTIPVVVSGLGTNPLDVRAGASQTCALTGGNGMMCWGDNGNGQLGDNTAINRLSPVDVFGLTAGIFQISPGGTHSCALTLAGRVDCWGANDFGQLGSGSYASLTTPIEVSGLTGGVLAISAGLTHTCALIYAGGDANTGGVKCWGDNSMGQLGDGAVEQTSDVPVDVSGLSSGVKAISSGWDHTCALLVSGPVMCWGSNANGQLGDGTTSTAYTPTTASFAPGAVVTAISGGGSHTCALLTTGEVDCWGLNSSGQLGDSTTSTRFTPVAVTGISTATAISAGYAQTCAILSTAAVQCWGANDSGQLGNGTLTGSNAPVTVTGLDNAAKITTGRSHSCALTTANLVVCWGSNLLGQLGIGISVDRYIPVQVIMQ